MDVSIHLKLQCSLSKELSVSVPEPSEEAFTPQQIWEHFLLLSVPLWRWCFSQPRGEEN